jgi:hypothetical protein
LELHKISSDNNSGSSNKNKTAPLKMSRITEQKYNNNIKAINNNNSKENVSKNNINKRDASNAMQYEMFTGSLNLSKQ